ncbi:hypothetical protein UB44_15610 [Burkholderiaceae bacterium 26]|nr:hypothetical protein UB44_15610 [Burkholderiaceae bacterium 26]
MREALVDVENADHLHTDFYDRTRLATWVRQFPGLTVWARERVGRVLAGWHPYSAWAGGTVDDEYLMDDKLRLHVGKRRDTQAQPILDGIDVLRDELARPGRAVRLVGLSGVGKTRFAQALFDCRIGARALAPFLAIYTNLVDEPSPQPIGLASDIVATGTRAVLVVDNCPPDLHRRLVDVCKRPESTISVLTIEYDVRDDQPEETRVVTLDTSSIELIEQLVARRYTHLSRVDARTIAEVSGGNARIAIALAETVKRSDSIAGLSNDELFDRLFRQRHVHDNALLLAAQACSLVYSFEGESVGGDHAELPRLAALAGQTVAETYRHVSELHHRELVQRRGVWRAVLPHAIANRLAARALDGIPFSLIEQALLGKGADRLARSFSRRLSYLHSHDSAKKIAQRWLEPEGLLGDVFSLNELGMAMFQNVAPVAPESALAAIERGCKTAESRSAYAWQKYVHVLRSISYDAELFERCAALLTEVATNGFDDQTSKLAKDVFTSLFKLHLSGTHATISQRLRVVEGLLRAADHGVQELGLAALGGVLQAVNFGPAWQFDFGARPRDFGYRPKSEQERHLWYSTALAFIENLALTEGVLKARLLQLLGKKFRPLWTWAHMHDELESLSIKITADGFWLDGWAGCRQIIRFDAGGQSPDLTSRIESLERLLRPIDLAARARAAVHGDSTGWEDTDEASADGHDLMARHQRMEERAVELGSAVALEGDILSAILPDIVLGGVRDHAFGRGLALAAPNIRATWGVLIDAFDRTPQDHLDTRLLSGFIAGLWERDCELAHELLDGALAHKRLLPLLPILSSSVVLDDRCLERLRQALATGQVPVHRYKQLMYGRTTSQLSAQILERLVLDIAQQTEGYHVAVDILYMRLSTDRIDGRSLAPELLDIGRALLRRPILRDRHADGDYNLGQLVKLCVTGPTASRVASDAVIAVRRAIESRETHVFEWSDFLFALTLAQPRAVLDALFGGNNTEEREVAVAEFQPTAHLRPNWMEAVPADTLIAWCAEDPTIRFVVAASIVTFAHGGQNGAPPVWTDHARMLLSAAPNKERVLAAFIDRFWPSSWSGSRAAIAEDNARLLDSSEVLALPELKPMVMQAKLTLAADIEKERRWETNHDQEMDGRFE